MADINANVVLSMPSQLFTAARSFRALAGGRIYIGKIDTDPTIKSNQIQVYVENEDGSHVPVSQPIIINQAGFPVYNGQIAKFVTVEGHSMAVYDLFGAQQFYFPNILKYDPDQFQLRLSSYADNNGDALIAVKQPYAGSVGLNAHDNNALFINVKQFGAIGDGSYHPLSERYASLALAQVQYPFVTAITQSIDWAAWQAALNTGKIVYGTDNAYVITDTLQPVTGGGIIGLGVNKWVSGFTATFNPSLTTGTTFLMYGNGARDYTLDCVSNMDVSGGVVANPSVGDPYTTSAPAPSYDLLDFTNGNAFGAIRATLKAFSVGILMPESGCVRLENFRIAPYFDGLEGYKQISNTGMGDQWDVGIWSRASHGNEYRGLQVVGYWRMAALLKSNIPASGAPAVQGEDENYYHCRFQGYKGVSIRACDVFKITAVGTSTIEIPWSASHTFDLSGTLRAGGVDFPYTGITFSGDKLTFTGVANASQATVGSTIRRNDQDNFGMAGTQFFDCYITSLYHHSHLMATSKYLSPPFPRPSECMEVSGEPVRGVQVHASTIQGWDDVLLHLHDCGNMNFYGTYFESQIPYQIVNGGNAAFGYGARMIASRQSTSSLPYAAGNTRTMRMVGCSEGNGVDWGPEFAGYTTGRYVSGSGVFRPRDSCIDNKSLPEQADSETRLVSEKGNVRVMPFTGKFLYVGPAASDANLQSNSGSFNILSGIRVRFGSTAGYWALIDSAKFTPVSDNVLALGQPAGRWTTVYATNSAISTSDANRKTPPREISKEEVSAFSTILRLPGVWQWLEKYQSEGDGARLHSGPTVQAAIAIMKANNLDWEQYGAFCFDKWDAIQEEKDEEGNIVTTGQEAGELYSFRKEELSWWCLRALASQIDDLSSRVSALEGK